MTVPPLNTAVIGLLTYYENVHVPDANWVLEDFIPYLASYVQYPDYIDGTYVYGQTYHIRIRTDKVIIVWAERTEEEIDPADVFGEVTHLKSYHIPYDSGVLYPVKAIEQLWSQVGYDAYVAPENQFSYDDVKVFDYEYPTCTSIYVVGRIGTSTGSNPFTYTVSVVSIELLSHFRAWGNHPDSYFSVNAVKVHTGGFPTDVGKWGDLEGITLAEGAANNCNVYSASDPNREKANLIVYLKD